MAKTWVVGLFVMLGLFCSELFGQIKAPDKIDQYKPIIIESQTPANIYIWSVREPATKVQVDGGKSLHVWAPPGKYTVQLTTIVVDFDKKDIKYAENYAEFEVLGGIGPTPVPVPVPVPVPTPIPQPTSAFKDKVKSALSKVDPSALSFKSKIAENYIEIAKEAKADKNAWDAATMVNEAKTRNSNTLPVATMKGWTGFWPELAKAFVELKLAASDLDGHIKAFEDVGAVLSLAAVKK